MYKFIFFVKVFNLGYLNYNQKIKTKLLDFN